MKLALLLAVLFLAVGAATVRYFDLALRVQPPHPFVEPYEYEVTGV